MKTAILIDDEFLARENIKNHLRDYDDIKIIGECSNGFDGYKAINELKPDLVFLDIQMPKINGFEMLELIDEKPTIIFTTAFDEYALKAFESGAVDYLLKPFPKERFHQAMDKFLAQTEKPTLTPIEDFTSDMPERQNRIVVKDRNEIRIIPVEKITYLEADDDYVTIHTADKRHLKNTTMKYLEETLNPKMFVRVHRSFIINTNALTKIEPFKKNSHIAILKDGTRIPISRNGYVTLKNKLEF